MKFSALFLIHYGWRGTRFSVAQWYAGYEFLIHYGWRGTSSYVTAGITYLGFLIHYGWRGTFLRLLICWLSLLVSNPLRLEGDLSNIAADDLLIWKFLIHYGWRGTLHWRRIITIEDGF